MKSIDFGFTSCEIFFFQVTLSKESPSSSSKKTPPRFHQFRNESEVNNESKGDYLDLEVTLPSSADGTVKLYLASHKQDAKKNPHGIHPNLLGLQPDKVSGKRKINFEEKQT